MGERPCDDAEMLRGLCDSEGASDSGHRKSLRTFLLCNRDGVRTAPAVQFSAWVPHMAVGTAMKGVRRF